jgi:hypothetical protein
MKYQVKKVMKKQSVVSEYRIGDETDFYYQAIKKLRELKGI